MAPAFVASTLVLALWAHHAYADGVCVTIDTERDNLSPAERKAVKAVITDTLRAERVAVAPVGEPCSITVVAYSIRLGQRITATVSAGDDKRTGSAASTDELDILYRQLMRALVRGQAMATGSGITDRVNVLRDQAAPRRAEPDGRQWHGYGAIGGGVLQLPAQNGRELQRQYNIVVIEARAWGFPTETRAGLEFLLRLTLHDYEIVRKAYDVDDDEPRATSRQIRGVALSLLAVPNYEFGLGLVKLYGSGYPKLALRGGFLAGLLFRLSDPDHYLDLGMGAYAGIGVQFSQTIGLSVSSHITHPVVHDFLDVGYPYFGTVTATLDLRQKGKTRAPSLLPGTKAQTAPLRRIND